MREKAFAQLCDRYGPFDEEAGAVLREGFRLADTSLASGAHVLRAALDRDFTRNVNVRGKTSHRPRDVTRETQELRLQQWRQHADLRKALMGWTGLPGDFSQGEASTYGLAAALAEAQSATGGSPISFFALFNALLICDVDILTITSSLNTPAEDWPALPYGGPGVASPFIPPTRHEATVSRRYAIRHRSQRPSLLNALAERAEDQVILARGPSGSPLQRIEHVLADLLIAPQEEDLIPERLTGFRHVFTQSILKFHAAGIDEINNAVANLRNSLAIARMWHAILILTRGEELLSTDPTKRAINNHLLGELSRPSAVPVVIAYEDQNEFTFEEDISLPYNAPRVVKMPAYKYDNMVNAIHEYYDVHWRADGITVPRDATDVLKHLHLALHAPSPRTAVMKRKVLPYSAADLIQEAVETVRTERRSKGHILARALTAKENIESFLKDRDEFQMLISSVETLADILQNPGVDQDLVPAAQEVYELWNPCCGALQHLPQQMQQLADHSTGHHTPQSYSIVTREIVAAQLFSDANYHLHVWHAFKESVVKIEPRLRDAISRRSKGS